MNDNNHTCLVLGQTGVGKSSFINAITNFEAKLEAKESDAAVTIEMKEAIYKSGEDYFKFIDTPGLNDAKGDTQNKNEIKKAASEYPDFKCILLLLNLQAPRIDKGIIETIKGYMEIFPLSYFWDHVIIVYTRAYRGKKSYKQKIENKRGEFIKSIKTQNDFKDLRKFMDENNIIFPPSIKEAFVDSENNAEELDEETLTEYNNILENIKKFPKMFKNIIHSDREKVTETYGKMKKIQHLRKITYIPRYGQNISLEEFVVPPEKDETDLTPIRCEYIRENTHQVISKKCKKYKIIKVYKINYYKYDGVEIKGNKNLVKNELELVS